MAIHVFADTPGALDNRERPFVDANFSYLLNGLQSVSVESLGALAVKGGTVDASIYFASALAIVSTLGGGMVTFTERYLIDVNLSVPDYCHLVGPLEMPGEILPGTAADYDGKRGVLKINSAATITTGNGASVSKCVLIRKGLDLPFSGAAAATAGLLAFAGTALTVGGADSTFSRLLILGFNQAIFSNGFERARCLLVSGDCNNGIEVSGAFDIPIHDDCHFWPFTTVHQSWTTNALLRRTGTAFRAQNVDDWMRYFGCFSYGYFRGFYCSTVDSVTYQNCGADNTSTLGIGDYAGSFGYALDGTCNEVRYLGCQSAAQQVGYYNANLAGRHTDYTSCHSWGCATTNIQIVSGSATILGGTLRDTLIGVTIDTSADVVTIDDVRFNNNTTRPINVSVATSRVIIGQNDYGNFPVGSAIINGGYSVASQVSAATVNPPQYTDTFRLTGLTNPSAFNSGYAGRVLSIFVQDGFTLINGGASPTGVRTKTGANTPYAANSVLRMLYDGALWWEL